MQVIETEKLCPKVSNTNFANVVEMQNMGVSEQGTPIQYSTVNSRILVMWTPKQGAPNFRKLQYPHLPQPQTLTPQSRTSDSPKALNHETLLRGSWIIIIGVIIRITIVVTYISGLITPLLTTQANPLNLLLC